MRLIRHLKELFLEWLIDEECDYQCDDCDRLPKNLKDQAH